jgi:S-adenosylmethionine:tRNA ribosyltransferase-isomerase
VDISLFDYELPKSLIAQRPAERRDASRLLVLHRADGAIEHRGFSDLPEYLRAGDVLVLNETKVIKARLLGAKAGTGARVELFLIRSEGRLNHYSEDWEVLARPAKRLKKGQHIVFGADDGDGAYTGEGESDPELTAEVLGPINDGHMLVRFFFHGKFEDAVERLGHIPLPPYIKRGDAPEDAERYQTVYARNAGSVAAPTAGLHFTDELLDELRMKGVIVVPVTLDVGLGTFLPVKTPNIEEHRMHSETYRVGEESAREINAAKAEGRRVVCVGTTSVRTLESAAARGVDSGSGAGMTGVWNVRAGEGATDIFIYPGYGFKVVDALITNFHLPASTLLMLVSAFAGRERVLAAYAEAVRERYRFFSYGDAMFID